MRAAAALGGQPRGLGEQQPPRLEQRAGQRRVDGDRVGEDVEAGVRTPVLHPHRIAVLDVDQPQLLQALDALAQRGHVDAEVRGKGALRREAVARRVAAIEHGGDELAEDLLGQG